MAAWLALVIGNTRWHWAWFEDRRLIDSCHQANLPPDIHHWHQLLPVGWATRLASDEHPHLWVASVVPQQSRLLRQVARAGLSLHWLQADRIPISETYPTLGLDRLINLWGAGQRYGWPTLVIDSGTALTFTAGAEQQFRGGGILLGLRSHLSALESAAPALPEVELPQSLPKRWASSTPAAIQSGLVYSYLGTIHQYITDWQTKHAHSAIVFTGGDGGYWHRLYRQWLQLSASRNTAMLATKPDQLRHDPELMFWGVDAYRSFYLRADT